jgi:lysophospholipid acyltransferase (LPLAT)-like uncharacterized protein
MAKKRKPHQIVIDWLFAYVLAPLFAAILHVLCFTCRWDLRGRENIAPYWDGGKPCIVGCWHGRLVMIPYSWWKMGNGETYVLMGRNRNGELITRIVATFNMKAVRGGSRVGGAEARDAMEEAVRANPNATLSFTPDGPHGPRYVSKMGMAHLSRKLGIPVIWVSASAAGNLRSGTWDRFMLPLPFSKIRVTFEKPIYPADHAALTLEQYRDHIDALGRAYLAANDRAMGILTAEDQALLEAPVKG